MTARIRKISLYFKASLVAIFITTLSYFSIQGAVGFYLWQEQDKDVRRIMTTVSEVHNEVIDVLEKLNQLELKTCSDAHNLMMRKLLFTSNFIKDIGYLEGNTLFCTTGKGRLTPPFTGGRAPSLVTNEGLKFWRHIKLIILDNSYVSLVIRKGNYNLVLHEDAMHQLIEDGYDWELVYQKHQEVIHFAGEEELYSIPEPTLWDFLSSGDSHIVKRCDDQDAFCLGVKLNPERMEDESAVLGLFTVATSLLVGLFTYIICLKALRYLYSNHHRVYKAISDDSFHCVYQPIVDLKTEKIIGVEMLARLNDRIGKIAPDEFIPVIAQSDHTWSFTKNMLKKAVSELRQVENLPTDFKLNVNIFPSDINKKSILDLITKGKVSEFDRVLVLEVTESEELEDSSSLNQLRVLREEGIQIAIDDFGTGYSNLHQLRKMNAHILKIDRSFIQEMEDASIRSSLIEHIVAIAKQEGLFLVAEGIENSIQHNILRDMGVEYGQGWAFYREMTLDEFKTIWESS
ncbi:EAL domain-containing protein [Vibrio caribbeanicus]|uniref:EAL domain-containing protein n=1 Tax=Vibrio caribbeanicus TaxID=701175 RepID=UPI00228379DB|nr:EAL domain-containing protein [Vibrio caribbeanicus]MCY9843487.1 EAL domain-containing protein [Vibrio caribbeanicus]